MCTLRKLKSLLFEAGIRVVPRLCPRPFVGRGFSYVIEKSKINKKGDKIMKEKLQRIKEEALAQIQAADVPEKLNDVRVKYLGKKGELTAVLKSRCV